MVAAAVGMVTVALPTGPNACWRPPEFRLERFVLVTGGVTSIEALNMELARSSVYDKLTQKEITAKADLRNNADHGLFDKVRQPDVEDMLRWFWRFASERLR